jgi:hypothetical protein
MAFSATTNNNAADNAIDLFGQSCEDLGSDFFDQYLTFSPTDIDGADCLALKNSMLMERLPAKSDISIGASVLRGRKVRGPTSTGVRSGQRPAAQNPGSSHHHTPTTQFNHHFYSELSGRASISDSELLNLENIKIDSPDLRTDSVPSLACIPSPVRPTQRDTHVIEVCSKRLKKETPSAAKRLRSPIKKASISPKMLRASQSHPNMDLWGNNMSSKFHFDFERPLSPPHSGRPSIVSETENSTTSRDSHDLFSFNHGLPRYESRASGYETPLATPVLENTQPVTGSTQRHSSDAMSFPDTPHFDHQSSPSWSSADFHTYASATIPSPSVDSSTWWSHASTASMAQPSPTAMQVNNQRSKTLAHQFQAQLAYGASDINCSPNSKMANGLMIQLPGSPPQQSFVVTSPQGGIQQPGYFEHNDTQPHQHYRAPSDGYTPFGHQQSSSIDESVSRTSDSDSPCPSPKSSYQTRKRRVARTGKNKARTPSTSGMVDFVNFTPDDSRKILTGVAPSGSSKTKARREKEAMEKRRKLSQAALRAVQAAGGDVEELMEQGLFV